MRAVGQVIFALSYVICCLLLGERVAAQAVNPISVTEVWAQPDGTFYLTLTNKAGSTIQLAEVHSSLSTQIDFPTLALAPDEIYPDGIFKVVNLPEPLPVETAFQVTLTFEADTAFSVTIGIPVVDENPFQDNLHVDASATWMPPVAGEVGAVYLSLYNTAASGDRLIEVHIEGSGTTSLHETVVDDREVMRMRDLSEGIAVAARSETVLKPGGYHIMLENIVVPPTAGDTLFARLEFTSGTMLPIGIPVEYRDYSINAIDGATHPTVSEAQHPHALIIVTIIAAGLLLGLLLMRLSVTNGSSD